MISPLIIFIPLKFFISPSKTIKVKNYTSLYLVCSTIWKQDSRSCVLENGITFHDTRNVQSFYLNIVYFKELWDNINKNKKKDKMI